MDKKKTYIILAVVFFLAFLSFNIVLPPQFSLWNIPFKLGLDLQGGTHLVYEADLSDIEKENYSSAMAGLRDIIERRVNLFGVSEPVVQTQQEAGSYRLIVELAGIKDSKEAIKMIGKTPYLEFKEPRDEAETNVILEKLEELEGKNEQEILEIPDYETGLQDPYFKKTDLTGKYLSKAEMVFDSNTNAPLISLQFNEEGAKIFEELTANNIGKPIAIYIDGSLISAPVVQNKIPGGQAQITGKFTINEAKELARNLNAGALPVPIKLVSEQSVGPTLGAISLNKSLFAGIIGYLAVVIFMIIVYRLPGFLASIALAIYVLLVLAIFKLIPITLTLAGIGGFILSIGTAVDANILIFSRMREELKEGRSVSAAAEEGFRRAWPSIKDSNINSLIVCLILFWFSTSFIQGFALALSIGILVGMFSAIFITRVLLMAVLSQKLEKNKWLL